VIEILVQLALVSHAAGDWSRGTHLLGDALALGEPEGHIRVFLESGPGLTALLHRVAPDSTGGLHARTVLAAAEQEPPRPGQPAGGTPSTPAQPLVDSLSERELDVLRLLESDLGGPDIARELCVSVNTVRTHTRHIYAKLGVTTRREAVREAARLGLLRHPRR
jgi:LuxR family maltose regulon positive regulatory protein